MTDKPTRIGSDVRLIEAAEAELIDSGGHIEMLAVAKRAGLSVGLAYHHFGSKTGLIAAVVDRFYGPIRAISFGDAIPTDQDWCTREKARTKGLIDYYYDHPFAPLVAGRLGREPQVLDLENDHMDALLKEGARNLLAGQRQGVVAPFLDPAITITMLMGGLRQAIHTAILSEDRPDRHTLYLQVWQFIEGALRLQPSAQERSEGDKHVQQS